MIEYSEIGNMAEETDGQGNLKYNAGSICIHYYSTEFLADKCKVDALPKEYHVAQKAIAHTTVVDSKPVEYKPEKGEKNGIKLEIFIFDVFPVAENVCTLEAIRAEEFTPVKNADAEGAVDCPATACDIISTLHRKWLKDAGAELDGSAEAHVEISPLVSYGGEGLEGLKGGYPLNPYPNFPD